MNEKAIKTMIQEEIQKHQKEFPRLVPAGTIMAWAGPLKSIPKGWSLCDGKELNVADHPFLFEAIGTIWGGNGTPMFCLPDLQGYFLRGADNNSQVDPDADKRYKQHDPENIITEDEKVGSFQDDMVGPHHHNYQTWNGADQHHFGDYHNIPMNSIKEMTENNAGNETRPKNAYVHWIIKL